MFWKKKQQNTNVENVPNNTPTQVEQQNQIASLDKTENLVKKRALPKTEDEWKKIISDFEQYVNNNSEKVFKYSIIGLSVLSVAFIFTFLIPKEITYRVKGIFIEDVDSSIKEQADKEMKKIEVRSKLKLELIPSKYTPEQTDKYIAYVNQYIDKYQGEQNLYQNILEFVSDNCVTPANPNTDKYLKALIKKMHEHEKHFNQENKIIKSLIDKCTPQVEKYPLPDDLMRMRMELKHLNALVASRSEEVALLKQKHGAENVDDNGNLRMNFIPKNLLREQENRQKRILLEDGKLIQIQKSIYDYLEFVKKRGLPSKKYGGGVSGDDKTNKAIFITIMRDYGDDFSFYYRLYASAYGQEAANKLKKEVDWVIAQNQKS